MKIRRLYEEIENQKGLKVIEDFLDKESKFLMKKYKFDETKKVLYDLINEYFRKYNIIKYYDEVTSIDMSSTDITVTYLLEKDRYNDDEWDDIELEGAELEDFLNFLEDPEMYRNSKKYNL